MGWEEVKYRWTGDDWAKAAQAKGAQSAEPSQRPFILVTPYGLSPFQFQTSAMEGGQPVIKSRVYRASDADDRKPLQAWDIAAGDEVMLPLELADSGQKSMRDRFFTKGQEWVEIPAEAKGSTLLELCRSLYDTGQPRFDIYHVFSRKKPAPPGGSPADKTDDEWGTDSAARDELLSKLVGHWKNTDYHFEQVRQARAVNGDLPVPLTAADAAAVKPLVVLAEPPPVEAPKPVAPQGPSGDSGSGASLQGTFATRGQDPPSPYILLPGPLKTTLVRSFQERTARKEGSEKSLDSYWSKSTGCTDVWQLLNNSLSWQDVNTMVRVYQRMEAVDKTGALWRDHVRYIVCAQTYGIYMLQVVYSDQTPTREKLVAYLDEITHRQDTPQLANASGIFQCMHGGTVGWREVSTTDQLHISVQDGTDPSAFEDCHIDETSFTWGRSSDGSAKSAPLLYPGIPHFLQSQTKTIEIARPFFRLDEVLQSPDMMKLPVTPQTLAALNEWRNVRGTKAVAGEAGHKDALNLWNQYVDDIRAAVMASVRP